VITESLHNSGDEDYSIKGIKEKDQVSIQHYQITIATTYIIVFWSRLIVH